MNKLLAACSASLAIVCLILGYHHAQLALAQRAVERLGAVPTAAQLARIQSRIQAAAPELIPASRYLRGSLLLRGSDQDQAAAALEDFRMVTVRRPNWAPGWVAMVATKARLHQHDPEFHHALERALATGPNESKSFNDLFPWLRLRWHWLDAAEREALLEFTVRASWREPKWVVEQAGRYYFLDPLCRRSGDNRLAMLHCRRLGWDESPDAASAGEA